MAKQVINNGELFASVRAKLNSNFDELYNDDSSDLQLGETSTTAYRGDRGKTAYDHSQTLGNPHGLAWSDISGSVLAAVWLQITIASGGPPVLGATMQDNGGQSFVWSAFTFYVDTEEGFLTLTEDNQLEIVE